MNLLVSTQELKKLRYFTLSLMWPILKLACKYPGELKDLRCFTLSLMWLNLELAYNYPSELKNSRKSLVLFDAYLNGLRLI